MTDLNLSPTVAMLATPIIVLSVCTLLGKNLDGPIEAFMSATGSDGKQHDIAFVLTQTVHKGDGDYLLELTMG